MFVLKMINLCFLQKKKKKGKKQQIFARGYSFKEKSVLIRCAGGSALSVKAGDAVAVCGRLFQLVVLKAVKGGSVAL